jgi:NADPH:quinone reductase-like Zn-dependent oxidoreductase
MSKPVGGILFGVAFWTMAKEASANKVVREDPIIAGLGGVGAKVIAVSKDNWIKTDFGADYIISDYDKVVEQVNDITQGKMADVVLNSLGANTWENSFSCVGINGRWVTFGGLTGAELKLNVQSLYRKQIKLIGSNGSTRKEFNDVIDMSKELKVRVWKRFKLEDAKEALQALFAKERDGRILLDINNDI